MKWIKEGNVWLLQGKQRDSDWFEAHHGRISASGIISAMGRSPFKTKEEYILSLSRGHVSNFTDVAKIRMMNGTIREDAVRKRFSSDYSIEFEDISMGVPDWNPYYGASPDGKIVGKNGGLEIKTTNNLASYHRLKSYITLLQDHPEFFIKKERSHIFEGHYSQMQLNMAVFEWDFMYYVVEEYTTGERLAIIVYSNKEYHKEMFNLGDKFKEEFLIPAILTNDKYTPVMPS
jgi:hypothetical protein